MIKLIVALGNKGSQYKRTRHNSGWLFMDMFKKPLEPLSWQEKSHGFWTKATIEDSNLFFLLPQTYMNESGRSIQSFSSYYAISPSECMVIHDDIELPLGTIKIQEGGGSKGHNGLKSIVQHLNSHQFIRIRIGIGRPSRGSVSSFVLGNFTEDEMITLAQLFSISSDFLRYWITEHCPMQLLPKTIIV